MSESGYSSDEDCFYRDELVRLKRSIRVRGLLRKGAHGDIFVGAMRNEAKTAVILKVTKKRKCTTSFLNGRRVPNEAKFHYLAHQADPSGTVGYLDCFERVADFVIVMEKPSNSLDLLEFVNEYGQIDHKMASHIATQLAESTRLYKNVNIAHCDVKDENVLFNPLTGQTKIIDFGNATWFDKVTRESFGTPAFNPSELRSCAREFSVDSCTVYNIGCIIYTLLTASSPFYEGVEFDFQRHVQLNGSLDRSERHLLSKLLTHCVNRVQLNQL